jgi:hypothetical protein
METCTYIQIFRHRLELKHAGRSFGHHCINGTKAIRYFKDTKGICSLRPLLLKYNSFVIELKSSFIYLI